MDPVMRNIATSQTATHLRAGPSTLEAVGGGVSGRLATAHEVRTVVAALMGSIVVIGLVLIGSGLLVTHVLAHGLIGHWDGQTNGWLAHHRDSFLNTATSDLTQLGDSTTVVIIGAIATAVGLLLRWGRRVLLLLFGLTIELSDFLVSNYTVQRPRPSVHMGITPSTFSWPSGHTAAILVLYGGIALLVMVSTRSTFLRISAWTLAVGLTLSVAFARVYRGDHHPTDAIAGMALGVLALCAAVFVLRTWSASIDMRRRSADAANRLATTSPKRIAVDH